MKGVQFITNADNQRQAVVIDLELLKTKPEKVEDLMDVLVAEARRNEPKSDWSEVREKLLKKR